VRSIFESTYGLVSALGVAWVGSVAVYLRMYILSNTTSGEPHLKLLKTEPSFRLVTGPLNEFVNVE